MQVIPQFDDIQYSIRKFYGVNWTFHKALVNLTSNNITFTQFDIKSVYYNSDFLLHSTYNISAYLCNLSIRQTHLTILRVLSSCANGVDFGNKFQLLPL